MIVESNLKIKRYNPNDVVRVILPKMRDFFLLNNVMPVDIYVSEDYKTGKKILVYVFFKHETEELYTRWKNYDTEM